MTRAAWIAWKLWNRTRYYWPQAQTRKRTGERLAAEYARAGVDWTPPRRPWWLP